MASVAIICKGEFPKKEYPLYLLRSADHIVCCDGAAVTYMRRCRKIFGHERLPDAIIGDLDSLPQAMQKKFAGILVRESEQEYNDLNKAFRYVLGRYKDIDTIHILGAGGMREDHTIGNLSYLMEYAKEMAGLKKREILDGLEVRQGLNIDIVSDWTTAFAVTDTCSFQVGEGREVSIFSADNSLNIKSEGLKWKTDGVVFDNWWKATLNKADRDEVSLTFNHPSAALIILD
mgnify:CR=1 FL=1